MGSRQGKTRMFPGVELLLASPEASATAFQCEYESIRPIASGKRSDCGCFVGGELGSWGGDSC